MPLPETSATTTPRARGPVGQGEDVEEVAADGPRGAVVARELPPVGLDAGEQDERALDALGDAGARAR